MYHVREEGSGETAICYLCKKASFKHVALSSESILWVSKVTKEGEEDE